MLLACWMTGMLPLFMTAESASADMSQPYGFPGRASTSANPGDKCRGLGCNNDAIGVVGRDPYDHVSWSPVVNPRSYCLNCYNERILAALAFIRRERF